MAGRDWRNSTAAQAAVRTVQLAKYWLPWYGHKIDGRSPGRIVSSKLAKFHQAIQLSCPRYKHNELQKRATVVPGGKGQHVGSGVRAGLMRKGGNNTVKS